MKIKLKEAQDTIELKRKEAMANVERQTKAQWAISLCNFRVYYVHNLYVNKFSFTF